MATYVIWKSILSYHKYKSCITINNVTNSSYNYIYFKYSFILLKEKNYINKILDKFSFKDNETKKQIENIKNVANKYIETRNKG